MRSWQSLVDQRAAGHCEARLSERCVGVGQHYHHRKLRSRGGADSAANLVHICHQCHTFIHSSPGAKRAKDEGWLVASYSDPCEVPVYRYRRWVLLDDQGGLSPVVAS